jgi:hypothetical protein
MSKQTIKQIWLSPKLEKVAMVDTRADCMIGSDTGSKANPGVEMLGTCSVGS